MIYFRGEGALVKMGLNIWPLSEWQYSRGFILRFPQKQLYFRYSVITKRWIIHWESWWPWPKEFDSNPDWK